MSAELKQRFREARPMLGDQPEDQVLVVHTEEPSRGIETLRIKDAQGMDRIVRITVVGSPFVPAELGVTCEDEDAANEMIGLLRANDPELLQILIERMRARRG